MRKILLLLLVLPFYFTCKLQARIAHITEIINFTDECLFLKAPVQDCPYAGEEPTKHPSCRPYIAKFITLKTQDEYNLLKPARQKAAFFIRENTKSFIVDLKIPIVHPGFSDYFALNASPVSIRHYICIQRERERSSGEYFIGLQLKGDLFQISKGISPRDSGNEIYFNGEKLNKSTCLKKITPNSTFTIEIRNPVDQLNRPIKKLFDVLIKENNISPDKFAIARADICPIAYIDTFKSYRETTIVSVKFEKLKDEKYLVNFYNFMKKKDLIKRLAKVNNLPSVPNDKATVIFEFYSDINRNTFQLLLDEANNAKLHLK